MKGYENYIPYLAGLIDGEGCIYPKYSHGRTRPIIAIKVSMTHPGPIKLLKEVFGGSILYGPRKAPRRSIHIWSIYGIPAREVLEEILPWLIVKKSEALVGIELQNRVRSVGLHITSEDREARMSLATQLSELKRVRYDKV